jgi:hypothetical protein
MESTGKSRLWEWPSFRARGENNIIPERNFMPYFAQDLHERDPSRRYKGLIRQGTTQKAGMQFDLYFSADGFHWTPYENNPVIDASPRIGRWGPTSFMGWDPVRRTYAVHMENCHKHCPLGKRLIGQAESLGMIHLERARNHHSRPARLPGDRVLLHAGLSVPGV